MINRAIRRLKLLILVFLGLITLSIPMGICPKCGTKRIGYALNNPRHQMCPECGTGLTISEGEKQSLLKGYSPFTAEQYSVNGQATINANQSISKTSDDKD